MTPDKPTAADMAVDLRVLMGISHCGGPPVPEIAAKRALYAEYQLKRITVLLRRMLDNDPWAIDDVKAFLEEAK